MSAPKITTALLKELKKTYDFILLNFANCDLVGHSGDFKATQKATETLNKCLKHIVPRALDNGYTILLTADHGNAEFMKYKNGDNCPAHTLNPVIFITISHEKLKLRKNKTLGLKDVAPTVLKILGIKQPKEMKIELKVVES